MQGVLFNLGFVNRSTEEHGLTHINCFLILYIHKFKKKSKHFTDICPGRMDVRTDGQKFVISFNAQLGGWYYGDKHR